MLIRFFRRYFQHQWYATSNLLLDLNHQLRTNPTLKVYACPDNRAQEQNSIDRTRGRRSFIPNLEFSSSGPFQIILDWISSQILQIKLNDEIWSKQCSFQQRIVDNTDERGSIWFATETWALLSLQDCTLMINTQDGLVQISRSDRLHSFICDIVSQYCLKLGNHETIQPFSMRLQTARSSIADSIAALDIGPDTKKALSQLMTSIQPICIIRGHGVLTHGTQSFSLKELNLHYPGCYRTNPWIDWLFSRPHIDLRPEIIKSPTQQTMHASNMQPNIPTDSASTARQNWWNYLYTTNLPCIPSLDQIRKQYQYRPTWISAGIIVIGLCCLALLIHLKQVPLSLLFSHHAAVPTLVLYIAAISYTWTTSQKQSQKVLHDLPQAPLSAHAQTYVRSQAFQQPTSPPESVSPVDNDSDEEVTIVLNP